MFAIVPQIARVTFLLILSITPAFVDLNWQTVNSYRMFYALVPLTYRLSSILSFFASKPFFLVCSISGTVEPP